MRTPWGRVLEVDPRGRGRGRLARQERVRSTSCRRSRSALRSAALAGVFYAWQFSFFSPDDFAPLITFFAWMIVILGGLGRAWTVPVGALVFGVIFAGTRFFDFPPFSLLDSTERAYVRLDRDRARDHRADALPAAGDLRQPRRRWCWSEHRDPRGARRRAQLRRSCAPSTSASFRRRTTGSITGTDRARTAPASRRCSTCISGFLRPQRGRVQFDGRRIDRAPAHRIARAGLVRTFQVPRALTRMIRARQRPARGDPSSGRAAERAGAPPGRVRSRERRRTRARGRAARARSGSTTHAGEYAGVLSGGQRKLLDFARVLMAEPRLVLLDEPMAGVSPALARQLARARPATARPRRDDVPHRRARSRHRHARRATA